VTYAIENGIHVISSSIGFYNVAPGDGTGFLADEVARARNAGITWATAAGNQRERHWGGIFNDPDGDRFHEFTPGVEINCFAVAPGGECAAIPAGRLFIAFLRWDNWTAPVNQDYDLYIVRWNGSAWQNISSGGDSFQNGGANQRPTEIAVAQTSGGPTAYGIIIERYSATRANVNFNLFVEGARFRLNVPSRSLGDLADAPGAITVAALDSRSPFPRSRIARKGRPMARAARSMAVASSQIWRPSPMLIRAPTAQPRASSSTARRRPRRTSPEPPRWCGGPFPVMVPPRSPPS